MKYKSVFLTLIFTLLLCTIMSVSVGATDTQENNNLTDVGIFVLDKSDKKVVLIDGKTKKLYAASINVDVNSDNTTSATDARLLLRIVAKLEDINISVEECDINGDGSLSATDARLLLRYCAKLDTYYADKNGKRMTGFANDDSGKKMYFTDYGALANGYTKIDDSYYYFENGTMRNGLIINNNEVYYMSTSSGKGKNGFKTISGDLYCFENGIALRGFQTIDDNIYYFAEDGKAAKGSIEIDGVKYYFSDSNTLLDGFVEKDGKTYLYNGGKLHNGWYFDNLDVYYFTEGVMETNTKIGDVSFDGNGIASTKKITEATLPVCIRSILKDIGTSPKAIYNYVHNNFRYKLYAKSTPDNMVVRMLTNRRGACYDYAYLTKYLLEAAGYECIVIVGDSFTPTGTEHDWVLAKIDGVWRHIDTQKGTFMKTDAQMRNLGYRWRTAGLPAAK